MNKKFSIQNEQYSKPYHHLVNFGKEFKIFDSLPWGLEYNSYVSFIFKLIDNLPFKNLAEIGCGDGKILLELAKKYPHKHFEGYDLSKKSILFANAFGEGKNNLIFFNLDFEKSKKYDLVLCVEVLEHIPEEKINNFIETISHKLNNNGKLILSVPSKNLKLHPKHFRHYDVKLLINQVKSSFKIDNVFFIHNGKSKVVKVFNILLSNRLFILSNKQIINLILFFYNRYFKITSEKKGSHIIMVLSKSL